MQVTWQPFVSAVSFGPFGVLAQSADTKPGDLMLGDAGLKEHLAMSIQVTDSCWVKGEDMGLGPMC